MKKVLAVVLLAFGFVFYNCGNSKTLNATQLNFVGHWVQYLGEGKTASMELREDRTGLINDSINCEWTVSMGSFVITSPGQSKGYNYVLDDNKLVLDIVHINFKRQNGKSEVYVRKENFDDYLAKEQVKEAAKAERAAAERAERAVERAVEDEQITFTDKRDGKIYKKVKIGDQTWMAENLSHGGIYVNDWHQRKYGNVYVWPEAKKACPAGWHLPSDAEWTELENYVGSHAGEKLKSKTGWNSRRIEGDGNGTDEYGFSALPGGYGYSMEEARKTVSMQRDLAKKASRYTGKDRSGEISDIDDVFGDVGTTGAWWSATEAGSTEAVTRLIGAGMLNVKHPKTAFLSVRCVRD